VADGGHGVHAPHGVRGGIQPGVGEARLIPGPVRNIGYAGHAGRRDTLLFIVLVFEEKRKTESDASKLLILDTLPTPTVSYQSYLLP
jgi:hypothetical protein